MKITYTRTIAMLALTGLVAGCAANAHQASKSGGAANEGHRAAMFAKMDADADGFVSRDEMAAGVAERFARMDADGDGTVTGDERRAAREAKRSERRAERFARIDADGDGAITLDEMKVAAGMRMERRFLRLDVDGNGVVSSEEMASAKGHHHGRYHHGRGHGNGKRHAEGKGIGRHGAMTLDEMQARAMKRFERMDADGDGRISGDEIANHRGWKHHKRG